MRAIHSNEELSYLTHLGQVAGAASGATEPAPAGRASPVRERGGREGRGLVCTEAYPDSRDSGGMQALTEAGWDTLRLEFGAETQAWFVNHLLNLHGGEVRYVGDPRLVDVRSLPASGGFVSPSSLLHSRLWHCQTMRTEKTREWAFWNHGAGQTNRQWQHY